MIRFTVFLLAIVLGILAFFPSLVMARITNSTTTFIDFAPRNTGKQPMTFSEFLAAKAAETKAIYSLTWVANGEVRHSGGAYLPIHTLHSKDQKYDYADWGVGLEEPEGSEKPRFIVPIMTNIVDIGRRLFSFRLAREHVRTTALPKIWIGAIWHPPTKLSKRGLREYVFLHNIGVGASMRFWGFLPGTKEGP